MNPRLLLIVLVLLFAGAGCMSMRRRFEIHAGRIERACDHLLASKKGRAPEAVADYSRFLARIPAHPSLDGVRVRILRRRAEALRLAGVEEKAKADEVAAEEIIARSPYFERHPDERASPPPFGGPQRPRYGRHYYGLGIEIRPSLFLGSLPLNRMRSDSRSHPAQTVSGPDDLGGSWFGISMELALLARPEGRVCWGIEGRLSDFLEDRRPREDIHFDGHTFPAGERLRMNVSLIETTIFGRFFPGRKEQEWLGVDLGVNFLLFRVDMETCDPDHHRRDEAVVPLVFPGLWVERPLAWERLFLRGSLRLGGFYLPGRAAEVSAFGLEGELSLALYLTSMWSLNVGTRFEYTWFHEEKSGGRIKSFEFLAAGGCLEMLMRF